MKCLPLGLVYSDINSAELLEIAGSQDKVHRIDSFDNINDAKALISRGFTRSERGIIIIQMYITYMVHATQMPCCT